MRNRLNGRNYFEDLLNVTKRTSMSDANPNFLETQLKKAHLRLTACLAGLTTRFYGACLAGLG